jgi:cytochrome P450
MTQSPAGASTATGHEGAGQCPVAHITWDGPGREALAGHRMLDELRREGPLHKVEEGAGFFLVTRHEDALRVAQNAKVFPQTLKVLATGEESPFELVPETLNGPIHTKWRRVLAPYFSPGRIGTWHDKIVARADALIDGLIVKGQCDFTTEFALRYPTAIFLDLMGLPVEQLDDFLAWETAILHPDFSAGPPYEVMQRAQAEVTDYFVRVIAERRAMAPAVRPPGLVTEALSWQIDGEPVSDADLLSFYLLMFMAGLDTVTAELGYGFLHLATHPQDRQQLVQRPELIPGAVEELLRLYPIVNTPREAAEDTEVAGCPVRQGELVVISYPSAGRDEAKYDDSLTANFERPVMSHITFGAGPHRCLGSHLARHELLVAYQEWHKRIPEYWLKPDAPVVEASGGMMTLNTLPLQWQARPA